MNPDALRIIAVLLRLVASACFGLLATVAVGMPLVFLLLIGGSLFFMIRSVMILTGDVLS
jgi:hypothetical protein